MQQLYLSIPEPCHEDWQDMSPTQQGRFCNACARQVVDFSAMSDAQVLNYFSNSKNEKVCGRAYPDQLERTIALPKEPKKRLFWHWHYITLLFLFFGKTNAAKAQLGKIVVNSCKLDSVKKVNSNIAVNGQSGGTIKKNNTPAIKGDVIARQQLPDEVVLNKIEIKKNVKPVKPDRIIMGAVASLSDNVISPLYIIDGIPFLKGLPATFMPEDINNISILQAREAAAIFGPQAAAGAIVITTKIKNPVPVYKSMDSVFITSGTVCKKGRVVVGEMVAGVTIKKNIADTVKLVTTKITGALKIYPNPVKKGNAFTIDLKLTHAGSFNVQIIDAAGKIVLQQQVVAGSKNYTGQLQTSNTWSSGVYYVRVFNSDKKMVSTNSVLVQ